MYRFYSNPQGRVRVSVVGEHKEGALHVAVARCSKKDQFIRQKGRKIAEGRLQKGKLYAVYPMDECDSSTFLDYAKTIASEVEASKTCIAPQAV